MLNAQLKVQDGAKISSLKSTLPAPKPSLQSPKPEPRPLPSDTVTLSPQASDIHDTLARPGDPPANRVPLPFYPGITPEPEILPLPHYPNESQQPSPPRSEGGIGAGLGNISEDVLQRLQDALRQQQMLDRLREIAAGPRDKAFPDNWNPAPPNGGGGGGGGGINLLV